MNKLEYFLFANMTAAGFLRTDGPTKAAAVRKLEQQVGGSDTIRCEYFS